jgi:hypothetical protein
VASAGLWLTEDWAVSRATSKAVSSALNCCDIGGKPLVVVTGPSPCPPPGVPLADGPAPPAPLGRPFVTLVDVVLLGVPPELGAPPEPEALPGLNAEPPGLTTGLEVVVVAEQAAAVMANVTSNAVSPTDGGAVLVV